VHGNYVSVTLCFLFAAAYALYFHKNTSGLIFSALLFAISVATKTWPLIFLPLFLQNIASWKKRLSFLLISALLVGVLLLPVYLQDKTVFFNSFLKYRGNTGWWGFTGIYQIWPSKLTYFLMYFYQAYGSFVLGMVLLALYIFKTHKMDFFKGFVLITLAALTFMIGFGPQYLIWILPFLIVGSKKKMVYLFSGLTIVLFIVEYVFRPFNGVLCSYITGADSTTFGMEQFLFDNKWTNIIRLPFWIFLAVWMIYLTIRPATPLSKQPQG
jgi:uncharacterized membrane protein